jgi:membrane-associated phospholipid phosphatase
VSIVSRPLDSGARVLAHLGLGVVIVVGGGIVAGLLIGRVFSSEVLSVIDRPVTRALVGMRSPVLTDIMHGITWLGGTVFVTLVVGAAAVLSYYQTRRRRWPTFLVATILGAVALDNFVKYVINRPRPTLRPLVDPFGSSFPSGHSAAAAALCGSLAFLVTRDRGRRAQVGIWAAAAVIVVLVALSRVYLGAHWLTDVIGGAAVGGFWTSVTARATKYSDDRPPDDRLPDDRLRDPTTTAGPARLSPGG